MKIGILTTHDSINYGAVLQAYAMAEVYRRAGHETRLIDRRRDPRGLPLKWELSEYSAFRRLASVLNATGAWTERARRQKTLRFLREGIGFTDYHFRDWRDAPPDLGVDLVSIGSDQVLNADVNDPFDYLPGRIPAGTPAISYAASLGKGTVPEAIRGEFLAAVSRLKAVSVREAESVGFLAAGGVKAAHVVDPVALAGRGTWDRLTGPVTKSGRIFVYLLARRTPEDLDYLAAYAAKTGTAIDCFIGGLLFDPLTRRSHPRLYKNLRRWSRWRGVPGFTLHAAAGPVDFVRAIAAADAVVTSSYHALVFSALYGRNVRFVLPDAGMPQVGMMARVRDYAGTILRGPLLQPTLEAALESVRKDAPTETDDGELARRREFSAGWLEEALKC